MISEERLLELIKQEATIYTPDTLWESIGEIRLNKGMKIDKGKLDGEIGNLGLEGAMCFCCVPLEELYEFKADAEEYLKYGNITRTEKFPYVSWEEFQKQGNIIKFIDKNGNKCKVEGYFNLPIGGFIDVVQNGTGLCDLEYNKKDYLTALDLAVKLFKGEEV